MAVRTVRPLARPLSRAQDPLAKGTFAGPLLPSGPGRLGAGVSSAQNLLGFFSDPTGLAIDFATDQSAVVQDTTTPANNYRSSGTVANGALVGPGGLLAYSANSPSPKMCLQSNGNFGYGTHNYVHTSEDQTSGSWNDFSAGTTTATSGFAGPGGANNATRLVGNNANTWWGDGAGALTASANNVTIGCWLRADTPYSPSIKISLNGGSTYSSTVSVTTSWQQFSFTQLLAGTDTQNVRFAINIGNGNTTYITRVQVCLGATLLPYIKTTASLTPPQFSLPYEYNTAGVCQGILVEEQRSNLLTFSNTFSNAAWNQLNLTNISNTTTGPDGVSGSAILTNETTTNANHGVYQSLTKAASALAYTQTIYAKQGVGRTRIALQCQDGSGNGGNAVYDLAGVQVGVAAAGTGTPFTSMSASIYSVGNGWCKCVFQYTTNTAVTVFAAHYNDAGSGTGAANFSYAGTVGNGVYIWNADTQQASYVTSALGGSPIITGSASVTRAADAISFVVTSFPWTAAGPGTCYAKQSSAPATTVDASARLLGFAGSETPAYRNLNTQLGSFNGSTANTATLGSGDFTTSTPVKCGFSYDGTGFNLCGNNGSVTTGATVYSLATTMTVGNDNNAGNFLNAYMQQVALWPNKKTGAQLQALTT